MTRLVKWIVAVALLAVAVAVPVWMMGSAMIRPSPSAVAAAMPPAQDFTLKASDGLTIAATYWPGRTPNAPAVLLLHGNGGSRGQMAEHAAWLAAQGYAAMTIDFRGHGESAQVTHSFGLFESRDAAAAVNWLRRRQRGGKIAAIGVSLGGAASLLGDDGPIKTDALVLQAVYPDIRRAIRNRFVSVMGTVPGWMIEPLLSAQALPRYGVWPSRIAPLTALRGYRGAVFVIGGGEDRYTPPAETREMFAAAPGPKSLWLVDGADHGAVSGLDTPLYRARLLGFLGGAIGRP